MPTPNDTPCSRTELVRNNATVVEVCDCGLVHVHLGALSLRFEPSAFRALADTILEALARHEVVTCHRFPNLGVRGHGERTS